MFAYAAPVPPFGGLEWQEVQLAAVSGEASTWHARQTGPTFVEGEETSWQPPQLPVNVVEVTA